MLGSEAFETLGNRGQSRMVLLCDHASNHVPACVGGGSLGLPGADMERHIAYDIGARGVTAKLTEALDAAAVLSRFSRLVIDPNRGADDPTLLMRLYDGTLIPENRHADADEIARRKAAFYDPYHGAVADLIDGTPDPVLISVHSFSPQLRGRAPRPWHIGILSADDRRLADPLLALLAAERDLVVGDNEPYVGSLKGDCMDRHGLQRGLPHVLIEIRNDLIETEAGQAQWAERLAPILTRAVRDANV